jgi:hypothetical protein
MNRFAFAKAHAEQQFLGTGIASQDFSQAGHRRFVMILFAEPNADAVGIS